MYLGDSFIGCQQSIRILVATWLLALMLCLSHAAAQQQSNSNQNRPPRSQDKSVRKSLSDQDVDTKDPEDLDSLLNMDLNQLSQVGVRATAFSSNREVTGQDRQMVADLGAANVINGAEASTRNTTDAGSLLGASNNNPGVYIQQRSPIISDPRIRGYRFGQYLAHADGAAWYPARLDLDSILSKIDSKMIDDIVVVNGPYSARYGPGFSFIDVVTKATPRYEQGPGGSGKTFLTYNGNGQQLSGGQYLQSGGKYWGASVYYGDQIGADYRDGAGNRVPSSYHSRNLNLALGLDLTARTTVEFKYLRQDQTDVEMAGQFTDIDFLVTDGFVLDIRSKNRGWVDRIRGSVWYNRTRSEGSGGRAAKQALFNSVFDQPAPKGGLTLPRDSTTDFDLASAGYSLALTWGQTESVQTTVGTDLRSYETSLSETQVRPAGGGFQSGTSDVIAIIPESQFVNPGVFAEIVVPTNGRLKITGGVRADWVSVSAGPGAIIRRGGAGSDRDVIGPDRINSYALWSAYLTTDYSLTNSLTANLGFGAAQRPPTLTELYSQRPFVSVLQQGLNRVQGYPFLEPERLKQVDIGLRSQSKTFRSGIRGFHAWIDDYITSQGFAVDPTSGTTRITSVFVNTPDVRMFGGESFAEWDYNSKMTMFGSVMYVEGQNRTLNQLLFNTPTLPKPPGSSSGSAFGRSNFDQTVGQEPLPQMPPLEARIGVRFHDHPVHPTWGTELLARVVNSQDLVAAGSLLEEPTPGFTTLDFRGFYRPSRNHTLIFGVLNLTDKQYREHLDNRAGNQLFQPGITGYLGSEVNY